MQDAGKTGMRVLIIANPIAGGGQGKSRAEALHRALTARIPNAELHLTRAAGDGRETAAGTEADGIIVVGGDGTVNEVLNGMDLERAWLAVFPVGTANVVARALKMPRSPEAMAALAASGRTRPMDAGRCLAADGRPERRFLLGAGAGLDAAVVAAVHARRGKRLGLRGWVAPALKQIREYASPPIQVVVDGEEVAADGRYVVLGNCRYSAGVFPATPDAVFDDGLFDVSVFRHTNIVGLGALATASFLPGFTKRRDVIHARGREIAFAPGNGEAAPLQIDGDPAGFVPATFVMLPGAVRVLSTAKG